MCIRLDHQPHQSSVWTTMDASRKAVAMRRDVDDVTDAKNFHPLVAAT